MIRLSIDGQTVEVPEGTRIWEAARAAGIEIPVLCHDPRLSPVGVCRMCVVDVGERALTTSCTRTCESGMSVETDSPEIEGHRKMLTGLLMSDQPDPNEDRREATRGDNELLALARQHFPETLTDPRLAKGSARPCDDSSAVIAVDHQACILCDRCIRACNDVQSNEVLGRTGKSYATRIAFDLDAPMGESSCVSCGECAAVCPTGALVDKPINATAQPPEELTTVDSVCPYCGVGCALTYHVDESRNKIIFAEGRSHPANQSRLCVKGRYGWDYAQHDQRLTVPLIRRDTHYPKGALTEDVRGNSDGRRRPGGLVNSKEILSAFREASWDEALDRVATQLKNLIAESGPDSLAGFGSAKCSNEEAYLFQKLIRAGWGTNNIDHCTRLCHASSVAALLEGIGSGAVTTTYGDVSRSDAILIAGSNTTSNHPVAATFFKAARKRGVPMIVVDPRREGIADQASHYCRIKPSTDVAFYNAMMNVIIEENLADEAYIEKFTEGYEALRSTVASYTPERVAPICGVSPAHIREVAITFGKARNAIIFWGMGISQHVYGTNNSRCLIALALLTGNVGRPGSGLHPLRGQNNVQGASDSGLMPMVYPDYQSVADPAIREKFEAAWGRELSPTPGLTVVEITHSALEGTIRGMYIMGENPFLSDPNVNKVRQALSNLDFLVVQDIFPTETAEFADVILPASSYLEKLGTYTNTDRRVQIGRPALQSPGQARPDWKIICDLSRRMGLPMQYASPSEIFAEFAALTDSYHTLNYSNLGPSGKLWPNPDPEHEDGPVTLFENGFPTANGKARFVPAEWTASSELPSPTFPLILTTGRLLEHWHTGSMTRRSKALDALAPDAFVAIHPLDAADLGLKEGDHVRVTSPRGSVTLRALLTDRECQGAVFIPFHFREAAVNLLTRDDLDPDGKIPEFKFCAVRVEPVASPDQAEGSP